MKRQLLLVLLLIPLIAAGTVLPGMLMPTLAQETVTLAQREPVQITADNEPDFYSRIRSMSRYYQDGYLSGLIFNYVSPDIFGWTAEEMHTLYLEQVRGLDEYGLLPAISVSSLLDVDAVSGYDYSIGYYFDPGSRGGFPVVVFTCYIEPDNYYSFTTDLIERKTVELDFSGYTSISMYFDKASMKQYLLRYSDYLGLQSTNALNVWDNHNDWAMVSMEGDLFAVPPSEQVSLIQLRCSYTVSETDFDTCFYYFSIMPGESSRGETVDENPAFYADTE